MKNITSVALPFVCLLSVSLFIQPRTLPMVFFPLYSLPLKVIVLLLPTCIYLFNASHLPLCFVVYVCLSSETSSVSFPLTLDFLCLSYSFSYHVCEFLSLFLLIFPKVACFFLHHFVFLYRCVRNGSRVCIIFFPRLFFFFSFLQSCHDSRGFPHIHHLTAF